jgi:hypothetical protein
MRRVFQVTTVLLLVDVVVQFYFAAFGAFTEPANDSQFILHQMNGRVVLPALCLLVIAAAALARAPGRLIGFSAIPLGLMVVQIVLFVIAGLTGTTDDKSNLAGQLILGLHAVNGLAILGVTILLVRRASRFATRATAAGSATSAAEPPSPDQEPARS